MSRRLSEVGGGCDLLVVKGARTTDDLAPLGLPFAERFQRARSVVLVPADGPTKTVKGEILRVEFVDADSRVSKMAEVLQRIKHSYEELHPRQAYRAHEVVGMFLYYWVHNGSVVLDHLVQGDTESLDEAADVFIECDFGNDITRLATLFGDGDGATTPTLVPAASISESAGSGEAGRPDSP